MSFELFAERKDRILKAVALEKTDRVPVVLMGDAFCARLMGVKLSEFFMNPPIAQKAMLDTAIMLGVDGWNLPQTNYSVFMMAGASKMKLPGYELQEDALWQIDEAEMMTVEDYDTVIDKGWNAFFGQLVMTKISGGRDVFGDLHKFIEHAPTAGMNFAKSGVVPVAPLVTGLPVGAFSGARSFTKFIRDINKIPDKVAAAMDVYTAENLEILRQQIRAAHPVAVWVDGPRSAGEFFSPKLWQRFVWPYIQQFVDAIIEEGSVPYLHLDSNWERDLEYFRQLPKGKCIFGSDGFTDIFKLKEVLGDHMCIYGDVPPQLLTLGTPDEVYNYTARLVKEIGPTGFILAQGCCLPPNAKLENVKAMVAAGLGQ